jgi:hypothetical protein
VSCLSFAHGLPLTQAALDFVEARRSLQRRASDGAPFLMHPVEVASLLERSGYPDHVVAADKVSKVRELRYLLTEDLSPDEARVKLRRHRKSLLMLEHEIPGSRLVESLRFELESLEALPPHARPQT